MVVGLALMTAVSGCTALYQNHGYVPPEEDLQQLVPGVDTRATVDDVIGAPSAAGLLSGGDYYYVRSRVKTYGMLRPEVVDRQVLAISFDGQGVIANIERFGLRDGHPVALSRRVTDSSVSGKGFLQQILGNFGNLNPADFF
ncbi:outer membrane protein assembly factor BamE [Pelagivirga sediminicola]|uniref:Outer membrane protein assembly factor BamE n=2 Tax=Pelagivirga sediminicola TaxID=2170575 RepID=A0A2T7GC95_9RHOB|nr:outer membrane protein assembly factor BamE [Pelagivirga sediminicola]